MYRTTAIGLILCLLSACQAFSPKSLSPVVRDSADQYSQAMDEFNDRVLLANVLRARDNAPLNFNDLTTLNGSFSVSASLGLGASFGHVVTPSSVYPWSVTPMLSASSNPTLTMSTLNTQGFILTMIQPISPTYVLSKWNEGYDHELLMYLFMKSIKFCDDRRSSSIKPNCRDALEEAMQYASQSEEYYRRTVKDLSTAGLPIVDEYLRRIQLARMAAHHAHRHLGDEALKSHLDKADIALARAYSLAGSNPDQGQEVVEFINEALSEEQAAASERAAVASTCGPMNITKIHLNNPDDAEAMEDFKNLVNCLANSSTANGGDVDMKALMILDPLGNPIPFGETVSVQTPAAGSPAASAPASAQTGAQSTAPPGPGDLAAPTTAPNVRLDPAGCAVGQVLPYWVSVTYVKGANESLASPEVKIDLPAGCKLYIAKPASAGGATHYNVYVGASSGTISKQTAMPVALSDDWSEPKSGLVFGAQSVASAQMPPAPTSNPKLSSQSGGSRDAGTFYAVITYIAGGTESLPSPEASLHVGQWQVIHIDPPARPDLPSSVTHYNVYLGTSAGTQTRQNLLPIAINQAWTQSESGPALVAAYPLPKATQYAISTPGSQNTLTADTTIISTINGLSDGQLHVGNAACPSYLSTAGLCAAPKDSTAPYLQLYREYPAQVVMCVATKDDRFGGHVVMPVSLSDLETQAEAEPETRALMQRWKQASLDRRPKSPEIRRGIAAQLDKLSSIQMNYLDLHIDSFEANLAANIAKAASPAGGKGGGGSPSTSGGGSSPGTTGAAGGGGGGGAGAAGGAGTGNTSGAMPAVSLALTPNRVSAILDDRFCSKDQIVLTSSTEEEFDVQSAGFAHIEWRSIAEVIRYLGAIARHQADHQVPTWPLDLNTKTLFSVNGDNTGRVKVSYRGADFSVPDEPANAKDHGLQALALLNELISIAKISSNLPVTQPVEVLP